MLHGPYRPTAPAPVQPERRGLDYGYAIVVVCHLLTRDDHVGMMQLGAPESRS